MYKIEKKDYGVRLTFDGFVKTELMKNWLEESKQIVPSLKRDFGVFVDMRDMKPLPRDAQELMEQGQKMYKQSGMARSVVVLNSPTLTMQFKRIAKETGIDKWERYIDASKHNDWERLGADWLTKEIDPDNR